MGFLFEAGAEMWDNNIKDNLLQTIKWQENNNNLQYRQ